MRIDLIVGARPNFIKIAPIISAIENSNKINNYIKYRLIHTGQHYDNKMSGEIFKELGIPSPSVNFSIGSGTQAQQTAKIMMEYENLLMKESTDFCLVVGDVTSTMSCSIVAKKMNIKLIHVEAGIRSNDLTMPEEINRIVTDSITDYYFTTSKTANQNLLNNGVGKEKIFFVGNTMIDTLVKFRDSFKKPKHWEEIGLNEKNYIVLTLHRPSNVDEVSNLKLCINEIIKNSRGIPIVFPVHPRTKTKIKTLMSDRINQFVDENLYMIDPLPYLQFNFLIKHAKAVITDSGGITEEATVLDIPCMTLRNSTERPETVNLGTNELIGADPKAIEPALKKLLSGKWKKGKIPDLWDGKTSERIISHLLSFD
tara:strand:- start:8095 stop:9201 length:1107 start_codon:yes stop_codon:yes gene_type:complete